MFRSIRLCEEEEALTYYRYNGKDRYSDRFLHYKDPERYYKGSEFQKKTDGVGLTRSFRACLAEYMKVHRVEETDRRRADFLCYLHVIKFWDCFQDIRDMHHEKWPIIIEAGEQYGNAEFAELLVTQDTLGRQLLLKAAKNFCSWCIDRTIEIKIPQNHRITKKHKNTCESDFAGVFLWRRWWDSNPRTGHPVCRISSAVP